MSRIKKFKTEIFHILYTRDKYNYKGWKYYIDDYFISSLIILNILVIMLESFVHFSVHYNSYFLAFEYFTVTIFTIEYLMRLWVSNLRFPKLGWFRSRLKYIFSFIGIIDLLAILPFYIPFIYPIDSNQERFLRLLRIFRIFKLAHYSESLKLVGKVLGEKKRELLITVASTFILLLLVSAIMLELEKDIQPVKFNNIFGAFWWAMETLTTIGYGDVHPLTGWGKFLAGITAIFGIGLVAIPTGILSVGFLEEINKKKKKNKNITDRKRLLKKNRRKSKKQMVLNKNSSLNK